MRTENLDKIVESTIAKVGREIRLATPLGAGKANHVINAFYGVRRAHPDLGFLYNSYMDDFLYEDPDNRYAVGPGKKAYSSMSPTLVMKDGKLVMAIGSPGSARIISTVAQLVDRLVSCKNDPEDLLSPKF